ncbi:MAG: UDP-N-acetylglucosamine--N-acetylmuramyl-(pentapeptide) pyrophosphoryl-undecaprenol N-acetylglucosamine transferase [Microgenomates group bacterium]
MNNKKIVITGGHLTPALSVIEELEKRGWRIFFIGRKYASEESKTPSVESEVIPQRGIPFYPLIAGRVRRFFNWHTVISWLKIPIGFFQALYYLWKIKPGIILSFGGYLSVPVVFGGWLLRIPVITHEQTTVKGLATKFNSLFAKKIAISWRQTKKNFPKKKTVLTGNPLRKEIFLVEENFWRSLKYPENKPLIFVTGGNQGSQIINQTITKIIPQLLEKVNIFLQCGKLADKEMIKKLGEIKKSLPKELRKSFHYKRYLSPLEMGTLLNKADLVISRSGANTVAELAILGKPAILIPLPWLYQDEQTKNAKMLKRVGIAEILPQSSLTPEILLDLIFKMIKNLNSYQKNAFKAKKLVILDAGKRLADLVEKTFNEKN